MGKRPRIFLIPKLILSVSILIFKKGIVRDLGIYENPDELFKKYQKSLRRIKKWIYEHISRKRMNEKIENIRKL